MNSIFDVGANWDCEFRDEMNILYNITYFMANDSTFSTQKLKTFYVCIKLRLIK